MKIFLGMVAEYRSGIYKKQSHTIVSLHYTQYVRTSYVPLPINKFTRQKEISAAILNSSVLLYFDNSE